MSNSQNDQYYEHLKERLDEVQQPVAWPKTAANKIIRSIYHFSPLDGHRQSGCEWCGVPVLNKGYCSVLCKAWADMDGTFPV